MDKKYQHQQIEKNIYQQWLDQDLFTFKLQKNKSKFSIVLPPPNITGQLHLGHAWDSTIQDLLIRYHRLKGYNTLFVPGTDHAGIATQAKIMQRIKSENANHFASLTKKDFLNYANQWQTEYQGIIKEQWAKLGLSLNYNCQKFTLDPDVNQAVNKVFVKLYKKKLIYQGTKIVNWDPLLKTAISNIEVLYHEVKGKLYYLKYYLVNSSEYLTIATTRPETMFADQAVIVNNNDKRYAKFINQYVINPANNQQLKVIGDQYVDINFGTGAMKCTPAHDFNDYELAVKYHLAMPLCMNPDGTMNNLAAEFANLDRFECRKKLIAKMNIQNKLEKIEDYTHHVGFSERTNVVVEPYLSKQWFIKMNSIADLIKEKQNNTNDKVNFYPTLFEHQLIKWLDKIQDWCISRQLWWGHQIPVWYHKTNKKIYVGVKPPKNQEQYQQDNDVLDTWFSSSLWPLVTLNWPNVKASKWTNFFPVNVLVTAYDILFFWVVRMMTMGLELVNERPFQKVLIHGLIRAEDGLKMSKSLGNGVNPIAVIDKYGADALRFFLVTNSAPGQDLRFSTVKIESAWNLINKLWNAARYVLSHNYNQNVTLTMIKNCQLTAIDCWILKQLDLLIVKVNKNMEKYEFTIVTHDISDFIWNHYCAWYLELSKYNLQNKVTKKGTLLVLNYVLKQILIMLHAFMPFVTEAIYQRMNQKLTKSILLANFPVTSDLNFSPVMKQFTDNLILLVSAVRSIRKDLNLTNKRDLSLHLNTKNNFFNQQKDNFNQYLQHLVNARIKSIADESLVTKQKITKILPQIVIEVATETFIDKQIAIDKLNDEIKKLDAEILRSNNILNNQQFLAKAPAIKIKTEQDKLTNYQNQKTFVLEKLQELK